MGGYKISVGDIYAVAFPPDGLQGKLFVIVTYCDESSKDDKVYAIAGYVTYRKEWEKLSKRWASRRREDGIDCFHASDCESQHGEFSLMGVPQCRQLKIDLIGIVNEHKVSGVGAAILIEDFEHVRDNHPRGREVLGPDPYFLCFQMVLSAVGLQLHNENPGIRTSLVFEEQEEFSGRTKGLYDRFKLLNAKYASRLTTLTYAPKNKFIPLEIADNLAYEVMKQIYNDKYKPERPKRKSLEAMRPRIWQVDFMDADRMWRLCDASISGEERLKIMKQNLRLSKSRTSGS